MKDDQLTRAERIRLECLVQSLIATTIVSFDRPTIADILFNAEFIEKWLKAAKEDA